MCYGWFISKILLHLNDWFGVSLKLTLINFHFSNLYNNIHSLSGEVLITETPYSSILLSDYYTSHCQTCYHRMIAPIPCWCCAKVSQLISGFDSSLESISKMSLGILMRDIKSRSFKKLLHLMTSFMDESLSYLHFPSFKVRFCSDECRLEAWERFHKVECQQVKISLQILSSHILLVTDM